MLFSKLIFVVPAIAGCAFAESNKKKIENRMLRQALKANDGKAPE